MNRVALIAHDARKDELVAWVGRHVERLRRCTMVATGTTGARIKAAFPDLDLTSVKSGPLGGDQQIGAMIAEARLDMLIFFIDPLSPMPHDVDVKALTRLGTLYDLPMALNDATADRIMQGW
ncbi:methylglyoxal synthase [Glacieibacterium sp.]|uniref:methylglyoxal synthase n=1 Tax=Glacieibacterium sp. TaxID=2860237 RepID=UPI003B0095FA